MFVAQLQYTVTQGAQGKDWSADRMTSGDGFIAESSHTYKLQRNNGSQVKYDLIGNIADGTHLTRRSVVSILLGIQPFKFDMFQQNPEEFISKAIKLINEEKATMIVNDITYNLTNETYDSTIFTAEKNRDFGKAVSVKFCEA